MTLDELRIACTKARANRSELGMDPDEAHVVLVVPGERRGARARLMPGVLGRVVGTSTREGIPVTIVDVLVVDLERALKSLG